MIELRNLTIGFPGSGGDMDTVVRDLSLTVATGEKIGIVGESGSGKSLTALACLGLVPEPGRIIGGTVTIDSTDLGSIPARELRKWRGGTVGMVFQEASTALNPVFTIGFQLEETVRVHRGVDRFQARKIAIDLLHRTAIEDPEQIRRAYPHQISGGQAQRVMLALALAGEPRLLIADEPTSSLDTVTRGEILALLDELVCDHGFGLLLVSHDLTVVRNSVDRVVVMYGGEIVEEAPLVALFGDPKHPYSQMLLSAAASDPGGALEDPEKLTQAQNAAPATGCGFAARCGISRPECWRNHPQLVDCSGQRQVRCPVVESAPENEGPHV